MTRTEQQRAAYAAAARRRRAAQSEHARKRTNFVRRLRNHRLTLDAYRALFDAQFGRCAVCGDALEFDGYGTHVDHDHETGRFRGILCRFCNSAAGYVRDDPDRARKLAAYLERARSTAA